MKNNLNEEISRIKNMMKKMINEDFSNNEDTAWNEFGLYIFDNPNTHTTVRLLYDEGTGAQITVEGDGKGLDISIEVDVKGRLTRILEGQFYEWVKDEDREYYRPKIILNIDDEGYWRRFDNYPDLWVNYVNRDYNENDANNSYYDDDQDDYNDYDDNMSHNQRMHADRSDYADSRDDWDDTQKAEFKAGA
jgi:hypothetical protein